MKIVYRQSASFIPKAVEFCCWSMAHAVIKEGTVTIGFYADSYVELRGAQLRYCPFCGRKIVFQKSEEPYEDSSSSP